VPFGLLADLVLLAHAAFLAFVILGGFLALRRPRVAWLHVPAFLWGALIEFQGWICPLTPLENRFREAAGRPVYGGGCIDHYVGRAVYPEGLTRERQLVLGGVVLAGNLVIYAVLWRRRARQDTNRA
jgi:hypothetical protein